MDIYKIKQFRYTIGRDISIPTGNIIKCYYPVYIGVQAPSGTMILFGEERNEFEIGPTQILELDLKELNTSLNYLSVDYVPSGNNGNHIYINILYKEV